MNASDRIVDEFPALERLDGGARRRRVPFIEQQTPTECGAACLAMVLGYFGKHLRVTDVRAAVAAGRDGTSALVLLDAADRFGLRGRGLRLEVDDLARLPAGAILHWELDHYVVLERAGDDAIDIVDPSVGRRRVPLAQAARSFTGVALTFEPTDRFAPADARVAPVWRILRAVLAESGDWKRIVVVSALLQLFALALPILTGAVVDTVVPRGDAHLLTVLAATAAGIVAVTFFASLIRAHLLIQLRTVFDARMTLGFVEHMLRLPLAFFQQRPAGDLMMRINSNALIREILTSGALSAVIDGALVFGYLAILVAVNAVFAALVALFAVAQLAVAAAARRKQRELLAEALRTQADAESYLVELLGGVETVKAAGSEGRAAHHWSGLFVDQLNVGLRRSRLGAVVDALTATLRLAAPLVLLAYGAARALDGTLSLGSVMAACALAAGFLTPLSTLLATYSQLQLLRGYLDRIEDVLGTAPEQAGDAPRLVHQARGGVTVDGVSFAYAPTAPAVLRDVSVDIAPGAFVAIVGPSGSGKTTLGNLLLGLFRPTEGRVLYDGIDLAGLDLRALRQQLGVVQQKGALFSASVRANIAFGDPELPLEAVVDAARRAQLHDDIAAMPMGYDTMLVGGGVALSGGQRQRLALARALARQPAILLLDEATSALDSVCERAVQAQLATLACTRIVIAHRLATVREADLILVVDGGRIVERGRHDELLASGGAYAALFAAQMVGSQP